MKKIKKFPVLDGNNSWYDTTPYKSQLKSDTLNGNLGFDYVIIGGGFTGISAARRLAELKPKAKIAVFDALKIGQGASGRNSGFMLDIPSTVRSNNFDIKQSKKIVALNRFGIKKLKQLVNQFDINADWQESGQYLGANDADNYAKIDQTAQLLKAMDEPYEILNKKQLTKKLGTDYYSRALHTPGDVLVNPASLIIGLAKSLPNNVKVFENCPLRSMQLNGDKVLKFDGGKILAQTVLFATNAFNEVLHVAKSRLAPMFTYASMTRVLTGKELKSFKDVAAYGLTPAHDAGTTMRLTTDNRILIRNGLRASLTSSNSAQEKAREQHRLSLINRFPHLINVPFEFSWGGNICITLNGQSQFQENKPGVFSVAGMNGTGIVKGTFLGHFMAEKMCGIKSKERDLIEETSQPTWVPPEPLRGLGASARLYFEQRNAGSEV